MKNLRAIRKEEHGAGEWGTPELTNKYKAATPGQSSNVTEGNFKVTFAHEHPEGEKKHEYVVKAKHQNDADQKAMALHQKAHPQGKFTMWDSQPIHEDLTDACWKGYEAIGMKMKNGKKVPNCVPKEETTTIEKLVAESDDRKNFKITKHEKMAVEAEKKGDKRAQQYHLNIVNKLKNESVVSEATKAEPQMHLVTVTVTDPHHPAITQRKTKIMKRVRVSARDPKEAVEKAVAHYKKHGFKVHDAFHHSVMTESLDSDEIIDGYDSGNESNVDEAHKLGDKVKIVGGPKDVQGKMGRIGEIRHGLHKTAAKTYTVDHDAGSVQLGKEHIRAIKEDHAEEDAEELSMAKAQLREIVDMAQDLVDSMDDNDELEPWMHSKITTAYVNLDDVYSYITYGDEYSTDNDSKDEGDRKKEGLGEATNEQPEDGEENQAGLSDEEKVQIGKIKTLIRLGLIDGSQMQVTLRAIKKLDLDQPVTSSTERQAINNLVQQLIGVVTGDDTVFRKIRLNVQK